MTTDEEVIAGNRTVIEGFRVSGGVVAELGFPILLLTTTGARTGRRVTTPLGFARDDGCVFVVASNGGAPSHPAWFHNLRANPNVTVEIGTRVYETSAVVALGNERNRLYAAMAAEQPSLRAHARRTNREFPVVVLGAV